MYCNSTGLNPVLNVRGHADVETEDYGATLGGLMNVFFSEWSNSRADNLYLKLVTYDSLSLMEQRF